MICGASNEATLEQGGGVETSKILNITYAPDITVTSPIYSQNDAIRTVTCDPSGNPDSYIYHKWQHKSKYGDIIREFGGNKTLKLPDVQVRLRYQDSGEYVCTASNGIKNTFNKLEQTGSGLVSVNAQPVFTSDTIDRVKQFGEINKAVAIYVNVYSVPKFTNVVWTRDGIPIPTQNSAKYQLSSSSSIVQDKIHGKEVQLDGYNVTLTIHDLEANDFANYTVTLKSGFPDVKFITVLESASVPDIPGNFSQRDSAFTSFTVQWDPGSGGGYKQTFYIQYRVQGSSKWTSVSSGEEDINEQRRRRTYEVSNLQEGKAYELRMYAENKAMKRSNFTDVLIAFTTSSASTTSSVVIGAVVGVVVTLVIVCTSCIVILLIKRSQGKDQKEKNDKCYVNTGFQNIQNGDEYEEVENKFELTKVETVSGVKGSTVQLECPYKTPQGKRILWSRKTNPAIQYIDGTNINPDLPAELKFRLTVTGDHTAGYYHLSISDVRESDGGPYECFVSGTSGSVTTLQLTIITLKEDINMRFKMAIPS
ncbi:neural cell adhesion molecule 1-like [Mytilus galloprovincialis]|uniref:neural cell adhesion molecule 1-like n=1 Tax=Mytilus galloprovincialis TaxID=29158 RepID=UPI003F7CC61A